MNISYQFDRFEQVLMKSEIKRLRTVMILVHLCIRSGRNQGVNRLENDEIKKKEKIDVKENPNVAFQDGLKKALLGNPVGWGSTVCIVVLLILFLLFK